MKYFLGLTLCLLFMNSEMAHAKSSINLTTPKRQFSMYASIIQNIAAEHQENLSEALGEQLECRLVKVKPNIFKEPGVFSKGVYNLTLSALCNESIKNLKLIVNYGLDYGNPWSLTVIAEKSNGQKVSIYSEQTSTD